MFFEERLIFNAEGAKWESDVPKVDTPKLGLVPNEQVKALEAKSVSLRDEFLKKTPDVDTARDRYKAESARIEADTAAKKTKFVTAKTDEYTAGYSKPEYKSEVNKEMINLLNDKDPSAGNLLVRWIPGDLMSGKEIASVLQLATALGVGDAEKISNYLIDAAISKLKGEVIQSMVSKSVDADLAKEFPENPELIKMEADLSNREAELAKIERELDAVQTALEQYRKSEKKEDGYKEIDQLKIDIAEHDRNIADLNLRISNIKSAKIERVRELEDAKKKYDEVKAKTPTYNGKEVAAKRDELTKKYQKYYTEDRIGIAVVGNEMAKNSDLPDFVKAIASYQDGKMKELLNSPDKLNALLRGLGIQYPMDNVDYKGLVANMNTKIKELADTAIKSLVDSAVNADLKRELFDPANTELQAAKAEFARAKLYDDTFQKGITERQEALKKEQASKLEDQKRLVELSNELNLIPDAKTATDVDAANKAEKAIEAAKQESDSKLKEYQAKSHFEEREPKDGYVSGADARRAKEPVLAEARPKQKPADRTKASNTKTDVPKAEVSKTEGSVAGTTVESGATTSISTPAKEPETLVFKAEELGGYKHLDLNNHGQAFDGLYLPDGAKVYKAGDKVPGVGEVGVFVTKDGKTENKMSPDIRIIQISDKKFVILNLKDGSYRGVPIDAAKDIKISVEGKPVKYDVRTGSLNEPKSLDDFSVAKYDTGNVSREIGQNADGRIYGYLAKAMPGFVEGAERNEPKPELKVDVAVMTALREAGFLVEFKGLDEAGAQLYDFSLGDGTEGKVKISENKIAKLVVLDCEIDGKQFHGATKTLAEGVKLLMEEIKKEYKV